MIDYDADRTLYVSYDFDRTPKPQYWTWRKGSRRLRRFCRILSVRSTEPCDVASFAMAQQVSKVATAGYPRGHNPLRCHCSACGEWRCWRDGVPQALVDWFFMATWALFGVTWL